jgi:hypothetical protein
LVVDISGRTSGRSLADPEHPDTVLREAAREESPRFGVDPGVTRVQEKAQAIASPGPDDVPVSEVEAEQFCVIAIGEDNPLSRTAASTADIPARPARAASSDANRGPLFAPSPDGAQPGSRSGLRD